MSEAGEGRELFEVLVERARGASPEDDAGAVDFLVGEDAGAGAEDDLLADVGVVADADLAADDGVVADGAGSGDAGLGSDDDVFSDEDVVADVDEVVDFYAAGDAGFVEGSAVDGGVGADFDGVFDDEAALLGKLDVFAGGFVADITKSIRPEDGSGVDDDVVAEFDAGIEDGAGMDAAIAADDDAATDDCSGADGRAFADFCFGLDDSVGADADTAGRAGLIRR